MRAQLPTGGANPFLSNINRKDARRLDQIERDVRIVSDKGRIARKRKKYIHQAERAAYRDLVVEVAAHLAAEARAKRAAA